MNSTAPWWGTAVIALVGSLFGVVVTSLTTLSNRRIERRRLTREAKAKAYPAVSGAAMQLARLPVWPIVSGDPGELGDRLREFCEELQFITTPKVSEAATGLLSAAERHADILTGIRRDSKPGHNDALDRRFVTSYDTSRNELRSAVARFVAAGRQDLEIRGHYVPIQSPVDETPQQRDDAADPMAR